MAFPLSRLPPEVLAGITCYLSDLDIINGLCMCHDANLTRALNAGGLVDLTVSRREPYKNALLWRSLTAPPFGSLRSFTLQQVEFPQGLIWKLIRLLPKTLKRLQLDVKEAQTVFTKRSWESASLCDDRSCYKTGDNGEMVPLSDLFPHLEYCYLPIDTVAEDWPLETQLKFVELLPSTLTFLHLPDIDYLPLDLIGNLLPPNLQSLDCTL